MKILLVHVSHELKNNVRTHQQKTGTKKIHSILPIFAMISDSHTIKFILALMTAIKIDQFRNEENVAIFWRTKQKCSMYSKLTLMDVIDDLLMDFSFIMIIFLREKLLLPF